jgi:hypothetical protein
MEEHLREVAALVSQAMEVEHGEGDDGAAGDPG